MTEGEQDRPQEDPEHDDRWRGEERREPRSSFVERIGKARGRRASDREPEDDQGQPAR